MTSHPARAPRISAVYRVKTTRRPIGGFHDHARAQQEWEFQAQLPEWANAAYPARIQIDEKSGKVTVTSPDYREITGIQNRLSDVRPSLAASGLRRGREVGCYESNGTQHGELARRLADLVLNIYKSRLHRTYLPLGNVGRPNVAEWEKLSIFLNLLIPKLPAPREDLSKGILETIDMDSYRAEKKATMAIQLLDRDVEIGPAPVEGGAHRSEPELDRLSNILETFNDQFGTLFTDSDRVMKRIHDDVAPKVAADEAFQNANSPDTNRRVGINHRRLIGYQRTCRGRSSARR
jgi:hypothetical protein